MLWENRDDTWTGCLSCLPPFRIFRCRQQELAICFSHAPGLGCKCFLHSFTGLVLTGFKAIIRLDIELTSQLRFYQDMKSYSALKQLDPRSPADARAQEILENIAVHTGKK